MMPIGHPVLARMRASLALSRRDLRAAIKHLRAAAAADPHNCAVLFQLGDTLIRLGNVEEGRRYLSASKDHDALYELLERIEEPGARDDARLLAQIADASLRVGLRTEARSWYMLALQLDPTRTEIQKALYYLDRRGVRLTRRSPAGGGDESSRAGRAGAAGSVISTSLSDTRVAPRRVEYERSLADRARPVPGRCPAA